MIIVTNIGVHDQKPLVTIEHFTMSLRITGIIVFAQ
jgi:hypothetical protein